MIQRRDETKALWMNASQEQRDRWLSALPGHVIAFAPAPGAEPRPIFLSALRAWLNLSLRFNDRVVFIAPNIVSVYTITALDTSAKTMSTGAAVAELIGEASATVKGIQ